MSLRVYSRQWSPSFLLFLGRWHPTWRNTDLDWLFLPQHPEANECQHLDANPLSDAKPEVPATNHSILTPAWLTTDKEKGEIWVYLGTDIKDLVTLKCFQCLRVHILSFKCLGQREKVQQPAWVGEGVHTSYSKWPSPLSHSQSLPSGSAGQP